MMHYDHVILRTCKIGVYHVSTAVSRISEHWCIFGFCKGVGLVYIDEFALQPLTRFVWAYTASRVYPFCF